jgi:4-hydroxy-3-methylbut-2-enyl diphosphate reductase IspH
LNVGVTAGASTPNRVVGEVIARLVEWAEQPRDRATDPAPAAG